MVEQFYFTSGLVSTHEFRLYSNVRCGQRALDDILHRADNVLELRAIERPMLLSSWRVKIGIVPNSSAPQFTVCLNVVEVLPLKAPSPL